MIYEFLQQTVKKGLKKANKCNSAHVGTHIKLKPQNI